MELIIRVGKEPSLSKVTFAIISSDENNLLKGSFCKFSTQKFVCLFVFFVFFCGSVINISSGGGRFYY
jgi:hypothetical protein